VQQQLFMGSVASEDVEKTKDTLAKTWVPGTTKASVLTTATAAALEEAVAFTKPEAASSSAASRTVPLKVCAETNDAVGEALAEKGADGQWRVKYQPLEPEDPFDVKAYGERTLKVVMPNGQTLLKDSVSIVPNDNILPAARYVFHDALTNEPILIERVNLSVRAPGSSEVRMRDGSLPEDVGLPEGGVTLKATIDGYEVHDQKFLLLRGGKRYPTDPYHRKREKVEKIFLRQTMRANTFSATLRWAAAPRDLDLHCLNNEGAHVYYSNKQQGEMQLDIDVTSGFGPETMTVEPVPGRSYRIYVKNYSMEGDIARSGATIELRMKAKAGGQATQLKQVSCPTVPALNHRFWDVLTIHVDADGKASLQLTDKLVQQVEGDKDGGGGCFGAPAFG